MTRGLVGYVAALVAALAAGCSSKSEPKPAPAAPQVAPQDAGIDGITVLPGVDPASGMHLDDSPGTRIAPVGRPKNRPTRAIDIMLKSTPAGAVAAVDGRPIGTTPTFWPGESDGLEHEFTFTRAGYAAARYRFVPVASGVLHATLERIATDGPDGGLAPEIAPVFAPDAAPAPVPPPPPPAPVTPLDAAPADAPISEPPGAPSGLGPSP